MSQKFKDINFSQIFADNSADSANNISLMYSDPREFAIHLRSSARKRKNLLRKPFLFLILLLLILSNTVSSQCKKHAAQDRSFTTEGTANGIDYYYQNLIIQDIALANQQLFSDVSLRFEYKIHYVTDQCKLGQIEISVLPFTVTCLPLIYQGYNIASSIKPEKADLVFHVIQDGGFISDSLILFNVPLEIDSSLYNSLTSVSNDHATALSVTFSRAIFHFTKSSYEAFRDRILQIDQYYAASLIADSAITWAGKGFLTENGNKAERILRQLELERIINYIRPSQFNSVFVSGENDINGLSLKYKELLRLNNRLKAIIDFNRFDLESNKGMITEKKLIENYLDRFAHYHELAFKADFRFLNFIEGLARPAFSNAGLLAVQRELNQHSDWSWNTFRLWAQLLVNGLIERGKKFEIAENQIRALTYYESAGELAQLMNLHDSQATVFQLAGRIKNEISASYIEISRKSALTENPAMAVQYFHDVKNLYVDEFYIDPNSSLLEEYENWLFDNFESQVIKYIDLKKYRKAFIYLNEIQSNCMSSSSYRCPEQFHDWMKIVRDGIYHELLVKAGNVMADDEWREAEQIFGQAIAIRLQEGYRIDKDIMEARLEVRFRQMHYEELIDEGLRYFNTEELGSALYYFNKAEFLEKLSLLNPNVDLLTYRQDAARQVILQMLSDGRVKVWANDFESAGAILIKIKTMLSDYGIPENNSLTAQYFALEAEVSRTECELIFREYNDLMTQANSARSINDFILAQKITGEAVNLSMDHLNCRIRDDEAWYQKVLLETPADFQRMEKELDMAAKKSYSDYLIAFQELKNYYYRHKLLNLGIVFIPLFDRVVQMQDSAFLTGMLNNYIFLKDFDHAHKLLERMRELGIPSRPLVDEQKSVGEFFASRDAMNTAIDKPWKTLESYTGRDKWYRAFKWSYKRTWLKETKWKLKYWPFIWKK